MEFKTKIILCTRGLVKNIIFRHYTHISRFVFLVFLVVSVFPVYAVQPSTNVAMQLMSNKELETAMVEIDRLVVDNPDDPQLFPALLKLATSVPQTTSIRVIVSRYQELLDNDQIGVLRSVPADWAELNGFVDLALKELDQPGIPKAYERKILLMTELGEVSSEPLSQKIPIGLTSSIARYGDALDIDIDLLENLLRDSFENSLDEIDGGYTAAVSGYGLALILKEKNRNPELKRLIDDMGKRYPNSPEYALVSTGSQDNGSIASVVPLSSPATLMGSYVFACFTTCPSVVEAIRNFLRDQESRQGNLRSRVRNSEDQVSIQGEQLELIDFVTADTQSTNNSIGLINNWSQSEKIGNSLSKRQANSNMVKGNNITSGIRVVAVPSVGTIDSLPSSLEEKVTVSAIPNPAVFIIQSTTYTELNLATNLQLQLGASGFPAAIHSLTAKSGSLVHRVELIDKFTKTKAEQLLIMLEKIGYDSRLSMKYESGF